MEDAKNRRKEVSHVAASATAASIAPLGEPCCRQLCVRASRTIARGPFANVFEVLQGERGDGATLIFAMFLHMFLIR